MKQGLSFCLLIAVLTLPLKLFSQSNNFGVSGQLTVNANGDNGISANLFSGTANVNIPIFEHDVDGVPINVSLNYNTKGIKVDEIASCTGLGWNLFYGGGIFRTIKGIPDENLQQYSQSTAKGYWHLTKSSINYNDKNTYNSVIINSIDGQPDMFTAIFGGEQVNFIISDNNLIETIPINKNIKIERTNNGVVFTTFPKNTAVNLGFIITDSRGNKYYFVPGDKMKSDEWAFEKDPLNVYSTTLTWVIEKIETYIGNTIQFTYSESQEVTYVSSVVQNYLEIESGDRLYRDQPFGKLETDRNEYVGKFKLIKTIAGKDFSVAFNYDNDNNSNTRYDINGMGALENIKIQDKYLTTILNYYFQYSYFSSLSSESSSIPYVTRTYQQGHPGESHYRLKLNSITTAPATGAQKNYYSFTYNEHATRRLGDRTGPAKDHWGYGTYYTPTYPIGAPVSGWPFVPGNPFPPNGWALDGWSGTIPAEYRDLHFPAYNGPFGGSSSGAVVWFGAYKEPDPFFDHLQSFSLKKITNSMGGTKEFVYEYPSISQPSAITGQSVNYADGLRLQKTIEKDNYKSGGFFETVYEYSDGYYFYPGSKSSFSVTEFYNRRYTLEYKINNNNKYTIFNCISSNIPTLGDFGVQHGYNKVTTKKYYKEAGGATEYLGKNETYFSNVKNVPPNTTNTFSSYSGTAHNILLGFNVIPSTYVSSLFTINNNFHQSFDVLPYTDKQYFAAWAIGLPWKSITYDHLDQKTGEMVNEYEVHTRYLDNDNFLSLNALITKKCAYNYTNNNYAVDFFYPYSGNVLLKRSQKTEFLNNTESVTSSTSFTYDSRNNLSTSTGTNSEGDEIKDINYYTYNYTAAANPGINHLIANNVTDIIYKEKWKKINNVSYLMDAKGVGVGLFPFGSTTKARISNTYTLVVNAPIISTSVSPSGASFFNVNTASTGGNIASFKKACSMDKYNASGDVLQQTCNGYSTTSIVDGQVTAKVENARNDEIGFTSFEFGSDFGNFIFASSETTNLYSKTGLKCLYLTPGYTFNTLANFTVGRPYTFSFWKRNGGSVQVSKINSSGVTTSLTLNTGFSIGGWTYHWINYTPSISSDQIVVTGTCYMDEVRLYPTNCPIKTFTYRPLIGTTTENNENNVITYYKYDSKGSLQFAKDQYGNIIKQVKSAVNENE